MHPVLLSFLMQSLAVLHGSFIVGTKHISMIIKLDFAGPFSTWDVKYVGLLPKKHIVFHIYVAIEFPKFCVCTFHF